MSELSLANRTDLALYGRFGELGDRGDYLVVRTPEEPTSYLGNQIIIRGDVTADRVAQWLAVFRDEFSDLEAVRHVTLNVQGAIDPPPETKLRHVENLVLSLAKPFPAPALDTDFEVTRLNDDASWRLFVDWRFAQAKPAGRAYFHRHFASQRVLAEAGRAAWFIARVATTPAASLGIIDCHGVARFQAIQTEPAFQRRGIATHLVQLALAVADREFGADRAVLVASADNAGAISLYTRLGFAVAGKQSFLCSW
jgi:ribosomal protein S18 acetylase RimI-like enzyme